VLQRLLGADRQGRPHPRRGRGDAPPRRHVPLHWTQRANYGAKEASVANWQISRVYALLGEGGLARRFGQTSLEVLEGTDVGPFFAGYAQEALARAAAVLGNGAAVQMHLAAGRELAAQVENADHRSWLEGDLATVPV